MKKLFVGMVIMLIAYTAGAQFKLDAQLRPRAEYRNGYKTLTVPGTDAAFFISQRTRLNAAYKNEKYEFYLSLQDVRTWGSTSQLNVSDNFFSVHEAWGKFNFNKNFGIKIGRQEIKYDDARIFGNVEWAQQARKHDALLLVFRSNNDWKVDVGLAYNQNKENLFSTVYSVNNNYKTLQYAWVHKKIKKFSFSILLLNNGFQYSNEIDSVTTEYKTVYNQTAGTRLSYADGKFKFNGATYFQFGKDVKDRDLSASYFELDALFQIIDELGLMAGFEYLSGTNQDATDGKNTSFTPWYGTNHKFNGFMDYFFVGNWVNSVGLQDIFVQLIFTKNKWKAALATHFFSAPGNIVDPENTGSLMSSNLGTEVDITLAYKFSPELALVAGYSQMFATKSMEVMKGGSKDETNNWAYLMLVFKPTLYNK